MSQQRTTPQTSSSPDDLSAGYAQFRGVEHALLEAERQLSVAHRDYASGDGPRPDSVYREVLRLRKQARKMLDELADLFFGDELRGPRPFSETRPSR